MLHAYWFTYFIRPTPEPRSGSSGKSSKTQERKNSDRGKELAWDANSAVKIQTSNADSDRLVSIPDCSSDRSGLSALDCIGISTYQKKDNWFLRTGRVVWRERGPSNNSVLHYDTRAGLCIYVMCEWGKGVAERGNESWGSILPSAADRNLQFILVEADLCKGNRCEQ